MSKQRRRGAAATTKLPAIQPGSVNVAQDRPPSLTPRESILLATVLSAGVLLRVKGLMYSAVEHFDEGVYASNLFFGAPDYAYPLQRFYAPPLLPALIEAGMIVGLPANLAALVPSFLAGCGTIVAVWWLARSWFRPRAGIAAAALVALSPFPILFSAAALTDGLLGLWLVLAVDAMGRSFFAGDFRWAIGAGIYTGLAWWTKYNGWLPLAIGAAALPVLWIVARPPSRQWQKWLACLAVTVLVAGVAWSPYYFSLRASGGYGPIAENHAKYVVGLAGWWESARRQGANFFLLDGGWSGVTLLIAIALAAVTPALANEGSESTRQRRTIGMALIIVWWGGLVIATPAYWPYARLLLPGLLATWLGAAVVIEWLFRQRRDFLVRGLVSAVAMAALLSGLGWMWSVRGGVPAGNRRAVQRIAKEMGSDLDTIAPRPQPTTSPPTRAVYVFGEPAMFFQLATMGEAVVAPAQKVMTTSAMLEGKPLPTFLVAGPHAERDRQFREQLAAAGEQWRLVQSYEYQPSTLVWLDLHDPRQVEMDADGYMFRLYELRP